MTALHLSTSTGLPPAATLLADRGALARLAVGLALLGAATTVALLLDDRRIGYDSTWTKPLKFQLALLLQTATIAWALRQLPSALRRVAMPDALVMTWWVVVLFEAGYITLQGARGVASHFNRGTAWESVAASAMAAGAGVLVCTTAWVGLVALWQAWRTRRAGSLMPLAIGLGFVLGAWLAGWSGSAMGAARGYWPQPLIEPVLRLPLTGWVLSQTDLRIAHFVGLHQMQLLPALAALAAWAGWRRATTVGVLAAAALAAVLSVAVLVQP